MKWFGEFDIVDRLVLGVTVMAAGTSLALFAWLSMHPAFLVVLALWLAVMGPMIIRMRHAHRSRMDPDADQVTGLSLRRLFGSPDAVSWVTRALVVLAPVAAAAIVIRIAEEPLIWVGAVPIMAFVTAVLVAGTREYHRAVREGRSADVITTPGSRAMKD